MIEHRIGIALLGLVACGGGGGGGSSEPLVNDTTPDPEARVVAVGTTGYAGIDLGASTAQLQGTYPDAEVAPDVVTIRTRHADLDVVLTLMMNGDQVMALDADYGAFTDMAACGEMWSRVRAQLDADLGPSQEDNLAAYWSTASASIELACNPGEADDATLTATVAFPEPEL